MNLRSSSLTLISAAIIVLASWAALRLNAVDFAVNILSTTFLAAIFTVATRSVVTRLRRRRLARSYLASAEKNRYWVSRIVDGLSTIERRSQLRTFANMKEFDFRVDVSVDVTKDIGDWEEARLALQDYAQQVGIFDFSRRFIELEKRVNDLRPLQDAVERALRNYEPRPTADHYGLILRTTANTSRREVDDAFAALNRAVRPLVETAREALTLLDDKHSLRGLARERIPMPFPGWLFTTAVVAFVASTVAIGSAALAPDLFPAKFFEGVANNLCSGFVGLATAAIVAIFIERREKQVRLTHSASVVHGLSDTVQALFHELHTSPNHKSSRQLLQIAIALQNQVHVLRHARADARLEDALDSLVRDIRDLVDGNAQFNRPLPKVVTSAGAAAMQFAGLSLPPSPHGLHTLQAANNLQGRVIALYLGAQEMEEM